MGGDMGGDLGGDMDLPFAIGLLANAFGIGPLRLAIRHLATYHLPFAIDHWPLIMGNLASAIWPFAIGHLPLAIFH